MFKFFILILYIYKLFLINGIHYGKSISRSLQDSTVLLIITKNNNEVGYCGGNLLSNKLIITAAHCVTMINNNKQINIVKNFQNILFLKNKQTNKENVNVLWIEIHPLYQKYPSSSSYDVALIGVDNIVNCCLNSLESPSIAILPFNLINVIKNININFNYCFIIGYGKNENGFLMRQSKGIIYRRSLLFKYINNITFIGYYDNLSNEKEKFDQGDSGNGLYCEINNKIYLIGIASSCYYKNRVQKIIDINTFTIIFSKSIKIFIINVIEKKFLMNNINKLKKLCLQNNNSMLEVYNNLLKEIN
uniref:Peptidase S1 domain-containing protein n=1 Tax=Strongyloides stercoralis TaxID=6248 RepID=A0A0K0EL22_STRER